VFWPCGKPDVGLAPLKTQQLEAEVFNKGNVDGESHAGIFAC
jgi:hypothetical protein